MAEEKNPEQNVEPNDAERAQFEQDVLKAAQDAMNLEAEANASAGSATDKANAETKENRHPEQSEGSSEAPASEKAAEQPAAPSAEEILKQQLAESNDRFVRLMAEFENFRRRNAKEQLELIETANGKLLEKLSEVQDNFERAFASENKAKDLEAFEKGMQMIYNQFAKVQGSHGRRPRTNRPDRQGIRPEPPRSSDAAALRNYPGRSCCHRIPEGLQAQEQDPEDRKGYRFLREITPISPAFMPATPP